MTFSAPDMFSTIGCEWHVRKLADFAFRNKFFPDIFDFDGYLTSRLSVDRLLLPIVLTFHDLFLAIKTLIIKPSNDDGVIFDNFHRTTLFIFLP